ncbi:MAG: hypothetical protein ACJA0N_000004 [Pseudohongiellaceae bacterium]
MGTILREESHIGTAHAVELAEYMRDIAQGIVDRDDKAIVDCMAQLDEFMDIASKQIGALELVKD